MKIQRIDHIGIIVNDLYHVKAFFIELGLKELGETEVKGEWVEKIIGLDNVKETVAMLETPVGETMIELVKFHSPSDKKGLEQFPSNTLGIRHIAFAVEDIDSLVTNMEKKGAALIGDIQNYKNMYKLCYIRGPEGIILELAEKLKNNVGS
ncbi:glyoxalase [Tetragenococcus osmophilus]|uniref:Glyoxalase n=1 Tax=Tetragenococcus osmophilus TaxID=526944 RepID=A0AA38CYT5_9ENTE|nr:VOC family protein [Tetragenococcus osmophilus]AYW47913.1 glyoxalase [Tetragenococcus osmophilus]GMA53617.1 glyoxalase [Alicyclobacillus contaminans]GMA72445.1 glyoxalase [Tetragenococcus osmophilus]